MSDSCPLCKTEHPGVSVGVPKQLGPVKVYCGDMEISAKTPELLGAYCGLLMQEVQCLRRQLAEAQEASELRRIRAEKHAAKLQRCGAIIAKLERSREGLRRQHAEDKAEIARIAKTSDGVTILPGMVVRLRGLAETYRVQSLVVRSDGLIVPTFSEFQVLIDPQNIRSTSDSEAAREAAKDKP